MSYLQYELIDSVVCPLLLITSTSCLGFSLLYFLKYFYGRGRRK